MWRTRKWAAGRSWFSMWRVASRVGWSERAAMRGVRVGERGFRGGWARVVRGRREWDSEERVFGGGFIKCRESWRGGGGMMR